jgi:hypothetical protein
MGDRISLEEIELMVYEIVEDYFKNFPMDMLPDDYESHPRGMIASVMSNLGCIFLSHETLGPIFKVVARTEAIDDSQKEKAIELVSKCDHELEGWQVKNAMKDMLGEITDDTDLRGTLAKLFGKLNNQDGGSDSDIGRINWDGKEDDEGDENGQK